MTQTTVNKDKSIMLINENENDLFINQKIIENINFDGHVLPFNTAMESLNYLKHIDNVSAEHRKFVPDVILLDIHMPVMNCFSFLEEFNKLNIFKQKPVSAFILSCSLNSEDIKNPTILKTFLDLFQSP